ncbi:dipeptidase 1-like [Saccoglossus kowalevskii]|uniref:Dipeptidase n=1 Tax=Saccoglossus kowalevskii TaxID=10224 RepID=A0ABM0H0R5_SACKO|nr:PREDICTED: dipeptidase 1-like [Saccoglossus kowalevskii]
MSETSPLLPSTATSTYTRKCTSVVAVLSGLVFSVFVAIAIAVPVVLKSDNAVEVKVEDTAQGEYSLKNKIKTRDGYLEAARAIMQKVPLVDGHNDFPWSVRTNWDNQLSLFNMHDDLTEFAETDIPRLREGHVGAQFWAAYVPCETQFQDSLRQTMDQIDVIKRFVKQYSETFQFVTTSQGILDAHYNGRIGSLIGVESGHGIDSSLATIRLMYENGVRYMTLTHNCNTPWADNNKMTRDNTSEHDGLTDWGKIVVKEMNRLGMMVDLSHVSFMTMEDALDTSEAPIIFSHSGSYSICNHERNVPDHILDKTKDNGGIVMVNFVEDFVNCYPNKQEWSDVSQVADHIEYIANRIGVDYVGIGSDYDGTSSLPIGLEDVSTFPNLVAEMLYRGWQQEDIEKLIGLNLLRVFRHVEMVRDSLSDKPPYENRFRKGDSKEEDNNICRTHKYNLEESSPTKRHIDC